MTGLSDSRGRLAHEAAQGVEGLGGDGLVCVGQRVGITGEVVVRGGRRRTARAARGDARGLAKVVVDGDSARELVPGARTGRAWDRAAAHDDRCLGPEPIVGVNRLLARGRRVAWLRLGQEVAQDVEGGGRGRTQRVGLARGQASLARSRGLIVGVARGDVGHRVWSRVGDVVLSDGQLVPITVVGVRGRQAKRVGLGREVVVGVVAVSGVDVLVGRGLGVRQ